MYRANKLRMIVESCLLDNKEISFTVRWHKLASDNDLYAVICSIQGNLKVEAVDSLLTVKIVRDVSVKTYPFTDYFKDFEKVEAVQQLFGEQTAEVLHNLEVEFYNGRRYMSVSDVDGHIRINANYLNNGDLVDIYLDIIHELVHVKQFMDGKKLFSRNLISVNDILELEACRHAVAEARKLGMNDTQILEYLKTDRMTEEDLHTLASALNVNVAKSSNT